MGRLLGSHADTEDLDRSDLNKCPDCGCYFGGENCPLCGKTCPDDMRAGNRQPVKKKKKRGSNSSGRVVFIDWYHRWWFILLMLFIFPIIGVVLLVTSPHKTSHKIVFSLVGAVLLLVSYFGISNIFGFVRSMLEKPVDTSLSREEYVASCEDITAEDYFRNADSYKGKFVTLSLTVEEKVVDAEGKYYREKYTTYYICRDGNDDSFTLMIRDCVQDDPQNFKNGDVITIYGEGAGDFTVYDSEYYEYTAPGINVAYIELENSEK